MTELKIAKTLLIFSVIVIIFAATMSIIEKNKDYFSVASGVLTIFAILSLFSSYFCLPKQTEGSISVPNHIVYRIAGGMGVASGLLAILGALPNMTKWLNLLTKYGL